MANTKGACKGTMKTTIFKGVGTALVTPMNQDFSINYELFGKLVDYQLENGCDALVVAGTTGEGSTLEYEEHLELIRYAAERAGRKIPVIAGAGSSCTAHAAKLSKEAEKAGADALLQVTPYYNKTSQKGLIQHFSAIAKATDLPIILYNVPSRTGVDIAPETYKTLCEIENIVAAKEANGNLAHIAKTIMLCGDRLDIYSGNDDLITPALSLGAKGVISVLANLLPAQVHEQCESFFRGEAKKSAALQLKYLSLTEALFSDVNPVPIKRALNEMGIPVGGCRLPLCDMEPAAAKELDLALRQHRLYHKYGQNRVCAKTIFAFTKAAYANGK